MLSPEVEEVVVEVVVEEVEEVVELPPVPEPEFEQPAHMDTTHSAQTNFLNCPYTLSIAGLCK